MPHTHGHLLLGFSLTTVIPGDSFSRLFFSLYLPKAPQPEAQMAKVSSICDISYCSA